MGGKSPDGRPGKAREEAIVGEKSIYLHYEQRTLLGTASSMPLVAAVIFTISVCRAHACLFSDKDHELNLAILYHGF